LNGGGTIDVPSGKMYNLPVLLDLLKVLGLTLAGQDGVRGGTQFDIKGRRQLHQARPVRQRDQSAAATAA
jgi:hypothetical protein